MGDYPLRATHGKVHIDDASDIRALMTADAAGQLSYQSSFAELRPGDLWIDVVRNEPKFRDAVLAGVEAFIVDDDPRRREIGLRLSKTFPDARFVRPLRESFQRDPARFVGVESPAGVGETLFRQWLEALCVCGPKNQAEFERAATAAQPFLDLPEADNYIYLLPTYLGRPYEQWLPTALPRLIKDGLDGFLVGVSVDELPNLARALKGAAPNERRQFSSAVHDHLAKRWPQYAARVGQAVDVELGVS